MGNNKTHEELLTECLDLKLPVSRFDNTKTLQLHLQAVYDETEKLDKTPQDFYEEDIDGIYIGKWKGKVRIALGKFLPFL